MITGDHLLIGKETAKMLGMGTEVSAARKSVRSGEEDRQWPLASERYQ